MIEEHKIYRVMVDGCAADGAGVARMDGQVIFVKGGIRGESCDVLIEKVGRTAVWARVYDIARPSPARIVPQCLHFTKCGGCQLRHMNYAEELEVKRIRVEDALRRIGGTGLEVPPVLGAKTTRRYRNKAQFPVQPGPDGPLIGFYRGRSHSVIDVEDCLLQSESASRLRGAVADWMGTYRVSAYDERSGKGLVRHVYVRTNSRGQSLLCLLVNGKKVPSEGALVDTLRAAEPALVGVVLGINEKKNNVILGDSYRTLWGDAFLYDELCGLTFKLSVPSFYQVNAAQAEVLYAQALELAQLTGEETVLDLYCGIGTISLAMARSAKRVVGCEVVPEAVADAVENASRNGIQNAEFICADAAECARRLADQGVRPDVVCVDPPRKGLDPEVIDAVVSMGPARVVYVSCDSGTLARDVKRFEEQGYRADCAVAVDLFPRTAHVETVVLLSLKSGIPKIEVTMEVDSDSNYSPEEKATYQKIKEYVKDKYGLSVTNLYIAQIKDKCGLDKRLNYNLPKSEDAKKPKCTSEKEVAILDAFKHFGLV